MAFRSQGSPSKVPIARLQHLARAAYTLALLPAAFGTIACVYPQYALKCLDIPVPECPEEKKRTYALLRCLGTRDMILGMVTTTIYDLGPGILPFARQHRAQYYCLGVAMLFTGMLKWSDGFLAQQIVGKGEWKHWILVPLYTTLGLILTGRA